MFEVLNGGNAAPGKLIPSHGAVFVTFFSSVMVAIPDAMQTATLTIPLGDGNAGLGGAVVGGALVVGAAVVGCAVVGCAVVGCAVIVRTPENY